MSLVEVRPTVVGALRARKLIAPHFLPTSLLHSPRISDLIGAKVYIKYENHSLISSFKGRGAFNVMAQLDPAQQERGVVTSSTGNHGQGVALAGRLLGIRSRIFVPRGANTDKVASMRSLGGEVIAYGHDLDEARLRAQEVAAQENCFFVDDGGDVKLMEGAATIALEILEALPEFDSVFLPMGGGALASGCGSIFKAMAPKVRVVAVQTEGAPAMYRSWKAGHPIEVPTDTFADGLVSRVPVPLALNVIKAVVDHMVLVSDQDLCWGIRTLLSHTHNLAEGAGAAALAGCYQMRAELQGQTVVLLLSGGNLTEETLRWALQS